MNDPLLSGHSSPTTAPSDSKLPRIGVPLPRPAPTAKPRQYTKDESTALRFGLAEIGSQLPLGEDVSEIAVLLTKAATLAHWNQPSHGKPFNSKNGHYIERANGLFLYGEIERAWRWRIVEIARSEFLLILSDATDRPIAKAPIRLRWECSIAAA